MLSSKLILHYRGAEIDAELQAEEEQELKNKGKA